MSIGEITSADLLVGGLWRITTWSGTVHHLHVIPNDQGLGVYARWKRGDAPWQVVKTSLHLSPWGARREGEEGLDVLGVRVGCGVEIDYSLSHSWLTTEVVGIVAVEGPVEASHG